MVNLRIISFVFFKMHSFVFYFNFYHSCYLLLLFYFDGHLL